jgi:hypothetical protein
VIQLAETFRRSHSLEGEVRSILVVFGFPSLELSSKIPFMLEMPPLIELLRVGLMTPLDLPVDLRTSWRYAAVRDVKIGKMPSELWSERRAVSVSKTHYLPIEQFGRPRVPDRTMVAN